MTKLVNSQLFTTPLTSLNQMAAMLGICHVRRILSCVLILHSAHFYATFAVASGQHCYGILLCNVCIIAYT